MESEAMYNYDEKRWAEIAGILDGIKLHQMGSTKAMAMPPIHVRQLWFGMCAILRRIPDSDYSAVWPEAYDYQNFEKDIADPETNKK